MPRRLAQRGVPILDCRCPRIGRYLEPMFRTTPATTPEEYIAGLDEPHGAQVRKLDELIRREAPQLGDLVRQAAAADAPAAAPSDHEEG